MSKINQILIQLRNKYFNYRNLTYTFNFSEGHFNFTQILFIKVNLICIQIIINLCK